MGGKLHLRLNIGERPIANKYREGKMKRSLKRELKVLEIAKREANKPNHLFSVTPWSGLLAAFRVFCSVCIHCRRASSCYCLQCHNQFGLRENLLSLTGLRFHSALFDVFSALAHWLERTALLSLVSLYEVARICRIVIVTKWFYLTRLETRTKESNVYASIWVANPCAQ